MALEGLRNILPESRILTSDDDLRTYGKDWLTDYVPSPLCIVLPSSTDEIQKILRYCNEKNLALVPSGGRTGLSGGATATQGEVILSLEKLDKHLEVNKVESTISVDAGVITEKIQKVALENDLFFPIDLASKGSSQIGGNIATNAGGIRVIKYGNIRDWVVSLDVVLADGSLLTLNGELFKNNTGYDFRSLFIGSEGTLGVITRATLKLAPLPDNLVRVLCGVESLDSVITVLQNCRGRFTDVSAYELFPRNGMEKVLQHHSIKDPFEEAFPYYILIEIESIPEQARDTLEEFFCDLMERETLAWVVMSQNQRQLEELLALRELLSETLASLHTLHKNDISVPISKVPEFINKLESLLSDQYADFEVVIFGHIGDGNLHVNIIKPQDMDKDDFYAQAKDLDSKLFSLIRDFKGSVSAEHGVGLKKKAFLNYTRTEREIQLMQQIKTVFDPKGILNPGKIFDLP